MHLTATPHFDHAALISLPEAAVPQADPATGLIRQPSVAAQHLLQKNSPLHIIAVSQPISTSTPSTSSLSHRLPFQQGMQGHNASQNGKSHASAPSDSSPKQTSQPPAYPYEQTAAAVAAAAVPLEQGLRPIHPQDSLPSYLAAKHGPKHVQREDEMGEILCSTPTLNLHGNGLVTEVTLSSSNKGPFMM